MKIELIGNLIDQPDGSALAQLDMDEEGMMYLMQLGFESVLLKGIEAIKKEQQDGNDAGKESS